MSEEIQKAIQRATRSDDEPALFDLGTPWRDEWWGMPSFVHGDARPCRSITLNFLTPEDVRRFAAAANLKLTPQTDSAWYPQQPVLTGRYFYDGPPTDSKYPICIPSKGRADCQKTGKALARMGVSFRFFVEDTEYDAYCLSVGEKNVVRMPFHDLGQGSVPVRNFIWEWAKERGAARHWVLDDNISAFVRCSNNRRLVVRGGGFFRAMEDFVDRYENVPMAGPHHLGFVKDREPSITPTLWNSRVYSCILIDTRMPHRWRGRFNEDTDLSLRFLRDGFCTLLFRSLLMNKSATVGVRNAKPMKGGNTDNVYNTGDHRRAFAQSLADQHPDVVKVVWKFNRWHHQVDYSPFAGNRPILRSGVVPTVGDNEYGMHLSELPWYAPPEDASDDAPDDGGESTTEAAGQPQSESGIVL